MEHMMGGPPLGNALVALVAGAITLWVIVASIRMLVSPGETDPSHPKYSILRGDR